MKNFIIIIMTVLIYALSGCNKNTYTYQKNELSTLFFLSKNNLEATKNRYQNKDETIIPAVDTLIASCKRTIKSGTYTVMNKSAIPPSGSKHDYYSIGPYWWPDPTQPEGLPYIRKDGQMNPDSRSMKFDRQAMRLMVNAVFSLSLGYYYTDNEAFAKHAVSLLNTWFIDKETKMNPHLEYGQAIPGRVEGRGIGIIETVDFIFVIESIGLLERSPHFQSNHKNALIDWFDAYLTWLITSKHGIEEDNWHNNHGTYYDVQKLNFALFVGNDSIAAAVSEASKTRRLASHIKPDGRQPHELERNLSMHYSLYNLVAFFKLALLAENVNIDLWNYIAPEGQNLKIALDYLIPYYQGETWPYEQIRPFETTHNHLEKLLRIAYQKYHDPQYMKLMDHLSMNKDLSNRLNLLYPVND